MYKKISLLTIGAALVATPVLAAPGDAKGDADRAMTRAEAQTRAAERFAKMDVNNDGKIDAADRAAKRADMQAKRFASLDANGDGSISRAEWDNQNADRAAKRTARAAAGETRDGKRQAMRGPGKRGGQHGMGGRMMRGTDGNKAISLAEFQTAALARFDAADANKDGVVTAEERQAQRATWRAQRGAAAPKAQ
jgi:Tfp pilus assembly protein PilV